MYKEIINKNQGKINVLHDYASQVTTHLIRAINHQLAVNHVALQVE
jgi:hypothetical protein